MSRRQRGLLFALIALFLVTGPIYRQVLGGEQRLWRAWTMFRGVGLGYVDAHFWLRGPDGEEVRLDAYRTLGFAEVGDAPPALRGLTGADGLTETARALCDALPAGTDLRVRARIGVPSGWKTLAEAERNLCAP